MKVLFMGGTGNISSACVELALTKGYEVTLFNRGNREPSFSQPVQIIQGDRNNLPDLQRAAAGHFDVVADFVGYTPDQVAKDVEAFQGQVGQYIYISSASAYQKPLNHYVVTESTPLCNPFWQYSRNKIACEDLLTQAYREDDFPMTIVRPSYTYGETWVPCGLGGQGYTVPARMRRGAPVISHGDGQSMWVMTSNLDFAVGFVGLFGNALARGEDFHITSDEVLTWDQIYQTIARAAGCEVELVHISSDFIGTVYPDWLDGLRGDKACSVAFDNSKIKRVVPDFAAKVKVSFAQGMARSMAWYDADPTRQVIDKKTDVMLDRLIAAWRKAAADAALAVAD